MNIAFITAIYGPYEASTKKYAPQTIPCDFICFTNVHNINNDAGWIIDHTPYHDFFHSVADNGTEKNSSILRNIINNKHISFQS